VKDLLTDLQERFDWAMYLSLEAYEVLPDGKSIIRSDKDEQAIGVFRNLHDSVVSIPSNLMKTAEELRAVEPDLFELTLIYGIRTIGPKYIPADATEFVKTLNNSVQRDMGD
jgi:hypothetical protein